MAEVEKKHGSTPGKSQTQLQGPVGGPMSKKLKAGGDPVQGPLGRKGVTGNQSLRGEQTSHGMQAEGKMTSTRVRPDQVSASHSNIAQGLQPPGNMTVPKIYSFLDLEAAVCPPCVGVEPRVPSS